MNYLRTYIRLVRMCENRTPPVGYVEKHHVFPKSIFGENPRVVNLTPREHWVAHLLLFQITLRRYGRTHWKTVKMALAIQSMSIKSKYHEGREIKTSRVYETVRSVWVEGVSGENHWSKQPGKVNPFVELNKDPEVAKRRGENNSRILKEKSERGEHTWQDPEWIQRRSEDPNFRRSCSNGGSQGKGKHWWRNPLMSEQTKSFEKPEGDGWEPGRLSFKHKKNRVN